MIYPLLTLLALILIVAWAVRSPATRLQLIDGWQSVHRTFSFRLALLTGALGMLPALAEQLLPFASQFEALPQFFFITHDPRYKDWIAALTLFIAVARTIKLPPKPPAP